MTAQPATIEEARAALWRDLGTYILRADQDAALARFEDFLRTRPPGLRHTDACLMNAARQPPAVPVCIPECAALRAASRVL